MRGAGVPVLRAGVDGAVLLRQPARLRQAREGDGVRLLRRGRGQQKDMCVGGALISLRSVTTCVCRCRETLGVAYEFMKVPIWQKKYRRRLTLLPSFRTSNERGLAVLLALKTRELFLLGMLFVIYATFGTKGSIAISTGGRQGANVTGGREQ